MQRANSDTRSEFRCLNLEKEKDRQHSKEQNIDGDKKRNEKG